MLPVQSSAISRKTWGRNWYTILTQSSQCKEYTPLHKYLNHPLARHCLSMSSCLPKKSEEALLNIRCIVRGYHLCRFEVSAGEVFTANKKRGERGNAFKVLTIVDSSAAYSPSLWIPFGQYLQIFLCQSATNRYQFIYRLLLKIDTNR